MNRPFYALAALVAALTGSAVGIGPARCPSGVSRVAIDARAYCHRAVGSQYLVHFEEGASTESYDDESYDSEYHAFNTQGSDSNEPTQVNCPSKHACTRYEDSCGRDALTGQIYVPVLEVCHPTSEMVDYWSLFNNTSDLSASFENETWPTDERVVDVYQEECPFLKDTSSSVANGEISNASQDEIDYEALYTPNDYVEETTAIEVDWEAQRLSQAAYEDELEKARLSLQAWLATMLPVEPVAVAETADESSFFAEEDLAALWYEDTAIAASELPAEENTAEVESFNAVAEDYASAENAAAEAEYGDLAQPAPLAAETNELAAEVSANDEEFVPEYGPYGPQPPFAAEPDYVDYDQQYESSYELESLDAESDDTLGEAIEIESDDIYREAASENAETPENDDWEDETGEEVYLEANEYVEEEAESDGNPVQALRRIFNTLIEELLLMTPSLNDMNAGWETLDELHDATQAAIETGTEEFALLQEQADILANSTDFEQYFESAEYADGDIFAAQEEISEQETPSEEWRESLVSGLRATGTLLLNLADEVQNSQDQGNSVSARSTGTGNR
jgi:hypothetical protein